MLKSKTVQLVEKLFTCIRPERVDEIAKETGFIKRKRLVTANDFLTLLFHLHGNFAKCSIQELCTKILTEQDISVSRAGLDKKFTPEAVLFLQQLIQELLSEQKTATPSVLALEENWPFRSIRILDSSAIAVPDHQKKRASQTRQTSAKLQLEFDALSGVSTFLHLDFDNVNDTKMGGERIPFLSEEELCMQDLGYFSFSQFKKIEENEAFFLTKVRADAYLAYQNPFPSYHSNGKVVQSSLYHRIDLEKLCQKMEPGEHLELEGVHFGRDAHFPARCILFAHDNDQRQRRISKIDRRKTKTGKKPKQVVRDLAGITIYMTNLPEWISPSQLTELYRLRWQVELTFKVLKSYLKMDHFKVMKQERWLCHLYATILVFLISQLIAYQLRNVIWEEVQLEISEMVSIRCIATEWLPKLYQAWGNRKKAFKSCIDTVIRLLIKTARKPKSQRGTAFKRLQTS
ncbi:MULTISPECIES: IS4 family transposase [Oceanobacillus]|uniref:IS4 family transposase n=1 Tax=Oceanobacillus TaxID=182709 RepID=UPI0005961670|nr:MULTISPECIES: IS4 family transposase [Oceanobacillus]